MSIHYEPELIQYLLYKKVQCTAHNSMVHMRALCRNAYMYIEPVFAELCGFPDKGAAEKKSMSLNQHRSLRLSSYPDHTIS